MISCGHARCARRQAAGASPAKLGRSVALASAISRRGQGSRDGGVCGMAASQLAPSLRSRRSRPCYPGRARAVAGRGDETAAGQSRRRSSRALCVNRTNALWSDHALEYYTWYLACCCWRVAGVSLPACARLLSVCRLVIELLLVLIITIISVSTEYCLVESGRLGL